MPEAIINKYLHQPYLTTLNSCPSWQVRHSVLRIPVRDYALGCRRPVRSLQTEVIWILAIRSPAQWWQVACWFDPFTACQNGRLIALVSVGLNWAALRRVRTTFPSGLHVSHIVHIGCLLEIAQPPTLVTSRAAVFPSDTASLYACRCWSSDDVLWSSTTCSRKATYSSLSFN